jgi:ATP-binding cassette subfamily B protein
MLKLFRLLEPYRGYVVIVLVLSLAQSISSLLLPRLMSDIVDKGIVRGDQGAIYQVGGLMLLMSIVATGCAIAGSFYSSKVATGLAGFCAERSSRGRGLSVTSSTASVPPRW